MTRPIGRRAVVALAMTVTATVALASATRPALAQVPTTTTTAPTTATATTTGDSTDSPPTGTDVPRVEGSDGSTDGGSGGGGLAGALWGSVRSMIDGWFESLARAALKPVLELLGRSLFATPDVTGPGTVRGLWAYSLAVSDIALAVFVVMAGLVVMGHETVQTRYALKEVAPRLLWAAVAANVSLGVVAMAIAIANAMSSAFVSGFDPASGHLATETLMATIAGSLAGGNVFVTLLAIVVAALGIGVLVTYVARVATVVVLVGGAPLFLVAHALPQTEGAARLWWRSLVGCLGVQVAQSLVLTAALRVFFHDDGRSLAGMPGGSVMDLLVVGSLFWLLLRIPSYASRMVFAPRSGTFVQHVGREVVTRTVQAAKAAAAA